jgi:hypothetical protein
MCIRQWRTLEVHFIETPTFTRLVGRHFDDDAYRALQVALILRPEQGPVIPRSGGLRKVRLRILRRTVVEELHETEGF